MKYRLEFYDEYDNLILLVNTGVYDSHDDAVDAGELFLVKHTGANYFITVREDEREKEDNA